MPSHTPRSSKPKPAAATGPGSDDDFTMDTSVGEITVPSLAVAPQPGPIQLSEAVADGNQALAFLLMLRAATGDKYELIKSLPGDEQNDFLEAWAEHSGVRLGESKAS